MEIPRGTGSFSLMIKFLSVMDYPNGWMVGFFATSSTPPKLAPSQAEQGQAASSLPGDILQIARLVGRVCADGWLFTVSSLDRSFRVRKQEMKAMKKPGILSKIVQSCAVPYRRHWPLAAV